MQTADLCFQGVKKTIGLLLSRCHLHGENNALQQSAVCILHRRYKLEHTLCQLIKTTFRIKKKWDFGAEFNLYG